MDVLNCVLLNNKKPAAIAPLSSFLLSSPFVSPLLSFSLFVSLCLFVLSAEIFRRHLLVSRLWNCREIALLMTARNEMEMVKEKKNRLKLVEPRGQRVKPVSMG